MAAAQKLHTPSHLVHKQPELPTTPPPSYDSNVIGDGPAIVLAELTTTTTTEVVKTTTQTTHFFVPVSRTNAAPFPSFPNQKNSASVSDASTVDIAIRRPSILDKDLPPIPLDDVGSSTPNLASVAGSDAENEPSGCPQVSSTSDQALLYLQRPPMWSERSPSASALARASLGLGLPHVMPRASASVSAFSSEINTVPFTQVVSSTESHKITPIRKAKSFRFLQDTTHKPPDKAPPQLVVTRSRGVSCSDVHLNARMTRKKDKGDEFGPERASKPLPRRPSFFSLKKKTALELVPPHNRAPRRDRAPSLPLIPPFTPLDPSNSFDLSSSASTHSLECSRRRRPLSPPLPNGTDSDCASPKSCTKPPHPPITGLIGRLRSRSLYSDTAHHISSPPPTRNRIGSSVALAQSAESSIKRGRGEINPPLLHRLSLNLFTSPTFSKSLVPSPISTTLPVNSSQTSAQRRPQKTPSPGESPPAYVNRVLATFSKAEVASILASSGDPFYCEALRLYIKGFKFFRDPLDVALRKLLMDLGLPRETQQIDRVMEAFATRYAQCNPGLFSADDHPYILAFSLIMLHTDAFNKSNKRKMTKPDYIRNTRLPGVFPEILDYFYDNIVFAPFIFIEHPVDVDGQGASVYARSSVSLTNIGSFPIRARASSTPFVGKGNKNDPYYFITHELLEPLRLNIEEVVSLESPFSYVGTGGPWDEDKLQSSFNKSRIIEVGPVENSRSTTPFFNRGGITPSSSQRHSEDLAPISKELWKLTVAKYGTLNRKDDCLEGGKKSSNRKWRTWSVILTRSQLLFFRDSACAQSLLAQIDPPNDQAVSPQASLLRPDEVCSIADSVAIYDKTYTKYANVLRFVGPHGRQFLLQASGQQELNEWISCINYASAFRSTEVHMRSQGTLSEDIEITAIVASPSVVSDNQNRAASPTKYSPRRGANQATEMHASELPRTNVTDEVGLQSEAKLARDVGLHASTESPADKEPSGLESPESPLTSQSASTTAGIVPAITPSPHAFARPPSIPQHYVLRQEIDHLETNIAEAQTRLETDMRFVRNIAILTPFRQNTRDRLRKALQEVAKRVTLVRLELARLVCHRDVLSDHLASYSRHRQPTAAMEAVDGPRPSVLPRMTLSSHEDPLSQRSKPLEIEILHPPPSSVSDSFYNGLDYGSDWLTPSSDTELSSFLGDPRRDFDSPATRSSAGSSFLSGEFPIAPERSSSLFTPQLSPEDRMEKHGDETVDIQEAPEEPTEEWAQCAQHVSIVHMPSELRLPKPLGQGFRQLALDDRSGERC